MVDKHILVVIAVHPARQEFSYLYTFYSCFLLFWEGYILTVFSNPIGGGGLFFVGVKK
jgi:hypothetical protein